MTPEIEFMFLATLLECQVGESCGNDYSQDKVYYAIQLHHQNYIEPITWYSYSGAEAQSSLTAGEDETAYNIKREGECCQNRDTWTSRTNYTTRSLCTRNSFSTTSRTTSTWSCLNDWPTTPTAEPSISATQCVRCSLKVPAC